MRNWIDRLLGIFIDPRNIEDIKGDLDELYRERKRDKGVFLAVITYLIELGSLVINFIIKPEKPYYKTFNEMSVWKNYTVTAFRSIRRQRLLTFLNSLGLATGLASALLIFLWIEDERSFDTFHEDLDLLHFAFVDSEYTGVGVITRASTPGPLAEALKSRYPEIIEAARITGETERLVSFDNNSFHQSARYVDPSFLRMLSFPAVWGDPSSALNDPNNIVLVKSVSDKLFGTENPIGKTLLLNGEYPMKVTAVLEEVPPNSSLGFEVLMSFAIYEKDQQWLKTWDNSSPMTLVSLREDASLEEVNEKIKDIINVQYEEEGWDNLGKDVFLHPMARLHLYGNLEQGTMEGGRIVYVRTFRLVGIMILLIACINFVNLSTAYSTRRAREVGMRKVMGAYPGQLVIQFLGESLTMALLSLVVAIGFILLLLPLFNQITANSIELDLSPELLFQAFGLAVFTGLVSGIYPALILSSFRVSNVLKGNVQSGLKGKKLRQVLVIIQFSFSIILIIGTVIVLRQVTYLTHSGTQGLKETTVYINLKGQTQEHYYKAVDRIRAIPGVTNATLSSRNPINMTSVTRNVIWPEKNPDDQIPFKFIHGDFNWLKTTAMKLVAGRDFHAGLVTDSLNYLINEKAAGIMGSTAQEIVNSEIRVFGKPGKIIGVMKDEHINSLRNEIDPLVVMIGNSPWHFRYLLVSLRNDQLETVLESINAIHEGFNLLYPFEYNFLQDDRAELYDPERQIGDLFKYFTLVSIVISCLGIFGLVSFSTERRIKEIGIRKVIGATSTHIVRLIMKDFVYLLLIAALVACPVGYYLINNWLNDFAYHISFGLTAPVLAVVLVLVISMSLVMYKAMVVLRSNPVNALKND